MIFLGKLLLLEKFNIGKEWVYKTLVYLIEHPIELKICFSSDEHGPYNLESLRNPKEINLLASDFIRKIIEKNWELLDSKQVQDLENRSQR